MTTPEQLYADAMSHRNRANPYPFFDELRRTPVVRVTDGIYAVTGYQEIVALTRDPRVSSDLRNRSQVGLIKPVLDDATAELMAAYGKDPSMIVQDPPDHDRMRRLAMRHFGPPHSPDLIPNLEGTCVEIVDDLLDMAQSKTRLDVVDDYAYPLPVNVICRVLGVPLADEPLFHVWIHDIMAGNFDVGPEMASEAGQQLKAKGQACFLELTMYIIRLVEAAETTPVPGMISAMVHDDGPDGRMSPSEIVNNTLLLLIAGHDSTVNLISHCVLTCLRNPGSLDLLRRKPELIPRAVEEVLRLQSSVQFFPSRTALVDIEIAGTTIPRGAPIFLIYGAGNRDPERFPDPNRFDPERKDNQHLGWGGGIHVCFGGPLARLEVNTAFTAFLRRVVNPRLVVDPPPYRASQVFRGPRHVAIDFDEILDRDAAL